MIEASAVIICVGAISSPRSPSERGLHPGLRSTLHSSAYRSPDQITTRSVLVVGSGSSGTQISRLLSQSGRLNRVHLSVSKVLVLPRSVMGIQVHRFIHYFRLFDVRTTSPLGRLMYSASSPGGTRSCPPIQVIWQVTME